jgi:hypothetical protein
MVAACSVAVVVMPPARVCAQTPTTKPQDVRVLSTDGVMRAGRLLALTSSEAVLLTNGVMETLPLEEVRRIDRVTHGARNGFLAGALSGLVVATASCSSSTDPGECWLQASAVFIGLGVAVGSAIGALYDVALKAQ